MHRGTELAATDQEGRRGDRTPGDRRGRAESEGNRARLMSTTSDRNDPRLTRGVDEEPVAMAAAYLVLSETDRAAGFVRPVRRSYIHTRGCGAVTTMGRAIAETYARDPHFYGATFCTGCSMHRPVGPDGEFDWFAGGDESIPAEYLRVGT